MIQTNKKVIKNTIYNKKLNKLNSFAILFKDKNLETLKLSRITKSNFLKLNKNIFKDTIIPANVYFYNYKSLSDLEKVKNSIILIKHKNNYFYKDQIESLFLNTNISKLNNFLGFYKKFYYLLKSISVK